MSRIPRPSLPSCTLRDGRWRSRPAVEQWFGGVASQRVEALCRRSHCHGVSYTLDSCAPSLSFRAPYQGLRRMHKRIGDAQTYGGMASARIGWTIPLLGWPPTQPCTRSAEGRKLTEPSHLHPTLTGTPRHRRKGMVFSLSRRHVRFCWQARVHVHHCHCYAASVR